MLKNGRTRDKRYTKRRTENERTSKRELATGAGRLRIDLRLPHFCSPSLFLSLSLCLTVKKKGKRALKRERNDGQRALNTNWNDGQRAWERTHGQRANVVLLEVGVPVQTTTPTRKMHQSVAEPTKVMEVTAQSGAILSLDGPLQKEKSALYRPRGKSQKKLGKTSQAGFLSIIERRRTRRRRLAMKPHKNIATRAHNILETDERQRALHY